MQIIYARLAPPSSTGIVYFVWWNKPQNLFRTRFLSPLLKFRRRFSFFAANSSGIELTFQFTFKRVLEISESARRGAQGLINLSRQESTWCRVAQRKWIKPLERREDTRRIIHSSSVPRARFRDENLCPFARSSRVNKVNKDCRRTAITANETEEDHSGRKFIRRFVCFSIALLAPLRAKLNSIQTNSITDNKALLIIIFYLYQDSTKN